MPERPSIWNAIFAEKGLVFPNPHQEMPRFTALLQEQDARTILDLGCGTGRHLLYLAQQGFAVSGIDSAPTALAISQQRLHERGLTAELRLQDIFDRLPYPDGAFEALLSTQVIHHARLIQIQALVQEIERILKPNGLIFITVPRLQNQATRFQPLEPGTFLPLDGREAGLLHHYFTKEELVDLFGHFRVLDLCLDRDQHYCLTGRGDRAALEQPGQERK
jgi:SAM-dependent methyltransferase